MCPTVLYQNTVATGRTGIFGPAPCGEADGRFLNDAAKLEYFREAVQNGARIKQMTETFPMLPLFAVVRRYAAERAQLERIDRKKSDFDLMIA